MAGNESLGGEKKFCEVSLCTVRASALLSHYFVDCLVLNDSLFPEHVSS